MGKYGAVFCAVLAFCGKATAAESVRIVAEPVSPQVQTYLPGALSNFPPDVDFYVEPLYPARNNHSRAKIDLLYYCVSEATGQRVIPCYITIDSPVAREGTGGHLAPHLDGRPTGRHVPSAGWVDEGDGYFRSTYYASEVGGVVDVTIRCDTRPIDCRSGKVAFGVGIGGLEDLGPGVGYVLTGAKPQHPSNHWGVPAFLAAVRKVAAQFSADHPGYVLYYNDISLEYGGVFDVETPNAVGYDWTPPHKTHRLGTNMDMGVPQGKERKALVLRLFQLMGVKVFQEDSRHWHLIY